MDQLTFDDSFFAQTMTTPAMMADRPLTPPCTDSVPTTIKMEDLHASFSTPSPAPSSAPSTSQKSSTPGPSSTNAEGKPVKKRKSWGQVLPEPKTSLPPRKRAKTEDEKEQRRIERVKRNRLAAHNSRERKRQEYEVLQAEKDKMESDLKAYKDKMALLEAELQFYRRKYPGEAPEPVFDLSSSTSTSVADTICPAQTSTSFPSPISMDSMDSPRDSSCQPETPAPFEGAGSECDLTQYPAVSVAYGFPSMDGCLGLSNPIQPHTSVDEKPVVIDSPFDFDQFPEGSPASTVESSFSLADSNVDLFGSSNVFGLGSHSAPFGFPDGFDAKFSDLQSASGATYVSDEALAAEL